MKKKLKWRLAELPSGGEVAELVAEGVITIDEARDMLFNEEEKIPKNKLKEFEEEIKFLRELCDKLAANSNGWTTIIKEYRDYKPHYPTWYSAYGGVMNANHTISNTYTTPAVNLVSHSSNNLSTIPTSASGVSSTGKQTKLLSKLN